MALARIHHGILNPLPQPARSPDGRLWLFLDGEIYNDEFNVPNQSQALVEAYLQEGAELFPRLNGSFTLALMEPERHRLTLVADRTASLPVFHTQAGKLFAFAPEIKSLLNLPGQRREINPEAVSDFLSTGGILGGKSLVKDIHLLRPGQVLKVESPVPQERQYWKFAFADRRDERDPSLLQENLYQLILQALERQARRQVSSAVTLSGGYDSRFLLHCLRQLYPDRPLRTITWGIDENRPESDARVARRTAEYYRTDHTFFELQAEALPQHFPTFVRLSEGRVDAAGNYPEGLRIFERIRGEIGVEVLYRGNEFFGARAKVTRSKEGFYTAFIPDLALQPYSFTYLRPQVRRRLVELGVNERRRLEQSCPHDHPVDRKDYLFITERVPSYQSPLTQLKRQLIEERNPFLDNDIIEFVRRLPPARRIWKELFTQTVRRYMPLDEIGMAKHVSLIDWNARLQSEAQLQSFVREILLVRNNGFDELLDRPRLQTFLDRCFTPTRINRQAFRSRLLRKLQQRFDRYELPSFLEVFRLLILKVWADEFLQGSFHLE